ncbi:defensin alpha-like protein 1 isoform X1 [Rattus rattus]|uniref:defensin alpha-like protein 1 isoform X1 n=1 Tax=Rattus rattus TaxID=10117 RepID=UPI0013F2BF5D|nr:defensin alpha-like protein 1 isoform X1 [Rattus rattus]
MKTLVLLSALVLLALQVQADPIQEAEEEAKTDEQPADEDQDVSVSFEGPEASAVQDLRECEVRRDLLCYCRISCQFWERLAGSCRSGGITYPLCCR